MWWARAARDAYVAPDRVEMRRRERGAKISQRRRRWGKGGAVRVVGPCVLRHAPRWGSRIGRERDHENSGRTGPWACLTAASAASLTSLHTSSSVRSASMERQSLTLASISSNAARTRVCMPGSS